MRKWLIGLILCVCWNMVALAQDKTPYEIALERIQEAERTGATRLNLSNLGLTELPPEIGKLHQLQWLQLWKNHLTHLPPEIGHLTRLRSVDLRDNQLTNLPAEIGQWGDLKYLYLSNNQLTSLPAEIGQLTRLSSLDLRHNRLTHLPPAMGQLKNLQKLILFNNHLVELPPAIGQLQSLCYLELSQNQLARLPKELGDVTSLEDPLYLCDYWGLHVTANPLRHPPPEVVAQGTSAILEYLRNTTENSVAGGMLGVGTSGGILLFVWRFRRTKTKRKNG